MMRILREPDDPWTSFLKGASRTALAVGIPLVIGGTLRVLNDWNSFWLGLGITLAMTVVFSLIAGVLCALSSVLQRWAYDRVTAGPFK
ncbi:MAG: hypothetical protein B7Z44_06740 [Caulobacter sp. 12-67-6]|nr:MAG: hypothetical protein B7Z44_06740 [Caulobacter sp. 12-67-6]OYX68721.1 MAG: hypothetical protein B7Y81_16240 [Caulobacter sp. 32-67-35]